MSPDDSTRKESGMTRLPDADDAPKVRNVNAPDLGGSFEENGQVRRHDGVGAGPGLQPIVPLTSTQVAKEQDKDSSAGS
jgi:hypothetical protein